MSEASPSQVGPVSDCLTYAGREVTLSWQPTPFWPPRDLITQASGVCYVADGRVVLVMGAHGRVSLPGGHLEPGEDPLEALIREVREEACATVTRHAYLGAQCVSDPAAPDGLHEYYQLRYWARVDLDSFEPHYETVRRLLVHPQDVLASLGWRATQVARCILAAAQEHDGPSRLARPR